MRIFSGLYKFQTLKTPKGSKTRPTSGRMRESFFNICQGEIEGATFLDLFAGSGAMGIEALSRGAKSATFVDKSKDSIQCIRENLEKLKITDGATIFLGNVETVIEKLYKKGSQFTLIYVDPPYDQRVEDSMHSSTYLKFLLKLLDNNCLLREGGALFIEESTQVKITSKEQWVNLEHKSSREMGKSALHHYVRRK